MVLYKVGGNNDTPISQADPYIIKEAGKYYIYTTGGHLFCSCQLESGWEYQGICLDMKDQRMCWAPCVIKIEDQFYMYYSSIDRDAKDEHSQKIRVAVSQKPEGPFCYIKDLLEPFSIDPHVVSTESGLYLFYSINDYISEKAGTYIVCDKLITPYTVEGHPKAVVRPSLVEEMFQKNRFKEGQDWYTLEGAFYFCVGTTHFLMYSGACYHNPTYFVGYCVAHGDSRSDLRNLEWRKYPNENTYQPLLCNNNFVEGTGHNSVLIENGKYYVVYHGRDHESVVGDIDTRTARLDEMYITGDKLQVIMTP